MLNILLDHIYFDDTHSKHLKVVAFLLIYVYGVSIYSHTQSFHFNNKTPVTEKKHSNIYIPKTSHFSFVYSRLYIALPIFMTYLLRLSLKSQSRRLICLILIANIYQFHSSASSTKAEKNCKTHLFYLQSKIEFVRLIRSICN